MQHNVLFSVGLALLVMLTSACATHKEDGAYLRWVGDIAFDPAQDDKDFYLCDEDNIYQYHNLSQGFQYIGEKPELMDAYLSQYVAPENCFLSGYLRIRFVVNCKAETDRFRIMAMDLEYKEMNFENTVNEQILSITKALRGWPVLELDGLPRDYYIYLIFKIENGHIIEILP